MPGNIIEKRYNLLTQTEDLIAISTPERIRKYVNKAYCHFFEKPESELVGTSFVEEFSPEKKEFYKKFIQQLSPGNPTLTTVVLSGPPDKTKWIHWKENGVYDEDGELMEIITVGRDVDETIRAKAQREAVTNLLSAYRVAIDKNIICSIADKAGVITYANKKFCDISQYSEADLIGKTHRVVNSGFHPAAFFDNMWETITSGKMWEGDIRNRAKDGSVYWVNTVIIPVMDADNKIGSFLSLRMLITEKKQHEEERANYLRSMEDMIYMVSHELRKPITSFIGLLDLLQHTAQDQKEYNNIIQFMIDTTKELDAYSIKINDYLQEHRKQATESKSDLTS